MGSLIEDRDIPEQPGVYLMKNNETIIYIGKAKNLKKRVTSYFNKTHTDKKTFELVNNIKDLEFIVCNSELDALILENNLIKKYTPKYNILLKDQKTYPYIKISNELYPKISIVRRTKNIDIKNGNYFGPYPNGSGFLLKTIIKIFKIRDCKKDMKKIHAKPCLKYHMNLCLAPCTYKDVQNEYTKNIEKAITFLKGNGEYLVAELQKDMKKLSESMEFERAISYREQIIAIENVLKTQITEVLKDIDEDIFVYKKENKLLFLTVLKVREGKIIGINNYNLQISIENEILVETFVRYYSNERTPKNIILDNEHIEKKDILTDWISSVFEKKVKLYFPKFKSRRKELLDMAYLNLEEEIKRYNLQKTNLEAGMKLLYDTMELQQFPRKIECFDISNISGKDAVGAMSVAVEGRLSKKHYRKYKIKTKDTPDDYHMMREVVSRRYSKLPEVEFPDLILIDGGMGQLNAVEGVLLDLGKIHLVDIISIAKREEEVFKAGESIPYIFDKMDESLKILQRLRDEAHRFGITFHRALRKKRVISSELDLIKGIGPVKRKELLKKFKSIKRMKEADLDSLMEIVSINIAKQIKQI
ncbi:MAG: excinuclease ABC subunit UvrC [Psychrilyobacter sp.]|nr:excinuclease ABC subunit UvrC [Psychrilyobacter sp.]